MRSRVLSGWVCPLVGVGLLAFVAGCSEGLPEEGATAPEVPQDSSTIGVPAGCSPMGMPQVLATHVTPTAAITATSDSSKVLVGFGTTHGTRVIASVNAQSLEAERVSDDDLGTRDASRGVSFGAPQGKKLVAWTAGRDFAWHVRTDADEVASLDPNDLGYQGAAIGRPAVAVMPDGKGVLAFIESNGLGFQLVATRLVCSGAR
jgi:hypothetical protein